MKHKFNRDNIPDSFEFFAERIWDQVVNMPWIAASMACSESDPDTFEVSDKLGVQCGFPIEGTIAFRMPQWWDGVKLDATFSVEFDYDYRGHVVRSVTVTRAL